MHILVASKHNPWAQQDGGQKSKDPSRAERQSGRPIIPVRFLLLTQKQPTRRSVRVIQKRTR